MRYPNGPTTVVQNYNVQAGMLIQLPCFLDQPEPPDGFRAIVFNSFDFAGYNPNQSGPAFPSFASGNSAAILFDLTSIIQNGSQQGMSRARFLNVAWMTYDESTNNSVAQGGLQVVFDSGFTIPLDMSEVGTNSGAGGVTNVSKSAVVQCDFLSATPIFAICADAITPALQTGYGVVTVSNFKLNFASGGMGSLPVNLV